ATPESVRFTVLDRGPGVDPELAERIFEPFVQVDQGTTRTHQGLGVGLHLACRIMQAHRGSVEVRPRPGGGSAFTLSFPALPGSEVRAEATGHEVAVATGSAGPAE